METKNEGAAPQFLTLTDGQSIRDALSDALIEARYWLRAAIVPADHLRMSLLSRMDAALALRVGEPGNAGASPPSAIASDSTAPDNEGDDP